MSSAQWGPDDEKLAVVAIAILVISLFASRTCLTPPIHLVDRPTTPPESLYEPGRGTK